MCAKKTNSKEMVQTSELKTIAQNKVDFSAKEQALYKKNVEELKNLYNSIENNFLDMAFRLYPIYKKGLYKIDGYTNIYNFAKENFELSRGTCNEFINICENLCTKSRDGRITGLKKEYEGFSLSKLRLLTAINLKEHKLFSPDMTVREMKAKKKELESNLLSKSGNTEKEPLHGEVELTIPPIFDRQFDSYDELFALRDELSKAWDSIKAQKQDAKLRIVVEGIEI